MYVVSDPEFVQHVLRKNWQNYKKGLAIQRVRLLLGNGLMASEGGHWKCQRRMIQPVFQQNTIGALPNVIATANLALRERWEQAARRKESVNVTRDVSVMILDIVLIWIFGNDYEEVAPQFGILSSEPARDMHLVQACRRLEKMIVQLVARRRRENVRSTDILGTVLEARDRDTGQVMQDRQLISEIMTPIVAGHETTASTLNSTWYLLSQNPEIEQKLSEELRVLPASEIPAIAELPKFAFTRQVIEEALRLYPPGWLITRRALKDDQFGDYFVPAGTEIYISPYLVQRHSAFWEAPDSFNPDRFGSDKSEDRHELTMLPFSAGPRNCIGEFLARIEMQIHIMIVSKRLRMKCVGEVPPDMDFGVNLRSRHDLIMKPEIKALPDYALPSVTERLVREPELHSVS